jgi:hypothetical protein
MPWSSISTDLQTPQGLSGQDLTSTSLCCAWTEFSQVLPILGGSVIMPVTQDALVHPDVFQMLLEPGLPSFLVDLFSI